jgi:uncharacterized protein YqeY
MDLKTKVTADTKTAMLAKDQLRVNTLRFLQAAIKNREIELRPNAISGDEMMAVLRKLVKQRKESIEQYQAGGREDLAQNEASELKILETYLPQQMAREQIEALVTQVITDLSAKTIKDMGSVIKEVIVRAQGAADNKSVSEIVKSKLQ